MGIESSAEFSVPYIVDLDSKQIDTYKDLLKMYKNT